MRVLTGPRWRLGARDLAALWRRALTLSGESPSTASPESIAMAASADADNPCLADAISDPGSAEGYSVAGYGRIGALAGELSALRGRLGHSLPDLVAEVRRVLGVDCEVRASAPVSGGWAGPEHLDAFADVVAGTPNGPALGPARRRLRACWLIWTSPRWSRTVCRLPS
ncbi:ATP-dependent DNA helicase [Mycobacterium tuberculosis variant africanum]|nr:ATP-dependent DNA helicase [Mycobacterium tuberculosis variant africanum]